MLTRQTLLLAIAGLLVGAYLFWPASRPVASFAPVTGLTLIAHAGGGLPEGTYTNAREAFDGSAARNFIYVEADLNWTKDGQLVLIHDWQESHVEWFTPLQRLPGWLDLSRWTRAPSVAAFKARSMQQDLTPMALTDLMSWLRTHPDIFIITDIKDRNADGLALIRETAPDMASRIIPQIYFPEEYQPVRALGYRDVILTAYRTQLGGADLASFADSHDLFALTVPLGRLSAEEIQQIVATGTPVFVHTVNAPDRAIELRQQGVSGLYTDFLYPGDTARDPD
tara:strand:- start:869 stop:1714 length:846 start_codon:yes stop_codon:yes gene_type:complete